MHGKLNYSYTDLEIKLLLSKIKDKSFDGVVPEIKDLKTANSEFLYTGAMIELFMLLAPETSADMVVFCEEARRRKEVAE